ncbi:MAG: hypothetical protein ACOVOB_08295, partial [Brevundimonas sp.]
RIRVAHLFAKVPARRKFLRSARSEYAACVDVVRRLAMARPDIGFSLEHDGRRAILVSPEEDRVSRVAALTDKDLADNSVAVDFRRGRWRRVDGGDRKGGLGPGVRLRGLRPRGLRPRGLRHGGLRHGGLRRQGRRHRFGCRGFQTRGRRIEGG